MGNVALAILGGVAYLGIGTVIAVRSMDEEMVFAPSKAFLWLYVINRTLFWPFLLLK